MASSVDADGRRREGLAAFASQLGIPEREVPAHLEERFGRRMADEAVLAVGAAWAPEHPLSERERSLLVLAALCTQGGAEQRLRTHVRWALKHGLGAEEIEAAVAFLAVYAGYPRASTAMEVVRSVLSGR